MSVESGATGELDAIKKVSHDKCIALREQANSKGTIPKVTTLIPPTPTPIVLLFLAQRSSKAMDSTSS